MKSAKPAPGMASVSLPDDYKLAPSGATAQEYECCSKDNLYRVIRLTYNATRSIIAS